MSSLITQLYNLINEAYIIYDAMIKAEYSIGSIVKSDRFTGIVIKNRGRFGITVINENGHHDWAPGENLTKIKNIKENQDICL
jgi:formylmethanofuran dehydrogenase subunit A